MCELYNLFAKTYKAYSRKASDFYTLLANPLLKVSVLEKKGLWKEVKGIKKEMKEISGGVYLSVGAIIIIILLLILLL